MVDKKVSLRVLYTINSSPQYILARSHARVPVDFIPCLEENDDSTCPDASKCTPLYASVSLKMCLDTICRSSPELTQDSNRDFSLYVLDPLESNSAPAPVNISNSSSDSSYSVNNNSSNAEQPRGVAVGLGFMSWALTADDADAATVVGTLVKQANGQQALEVIFALRETMAMKRPVWTMQPQPSSSSTQENAASVNECRRDVKPSVYQASIFFTHAGNQMQTRSSAIDTTRETLASIQMRTKAKIKPPKPIRQSTIPITESDKFLNAGTYIGPLKKKGRPKTIGSDTKLNSLQNSAVASSSGSGASSHPNDVIVIDGSDSEGTPPTPTQTAVDFFQSSKGKGSAVDRASLPIYTTKPLVANTLGASEIKQSDVQVKQEPQEIPNILDVLAYLTATSSESTAQNAAILAALNTIDSSNGQGKQPEGNRPNPQLISALKQLFSIYASSATQSPNSEHSNAQMTKPHRPSGSHLQEDTVVVRDKENVNPVAHQKRSEDGKAKHSDISLGSSSSPGPSRMTIHNTHPERHPHSLGRSSRSNENMSQRMPVEKIGRKRTLSDFMDEKEKGKNKGKERERVEKRDGRRHSGSQHNTKVAPVVDSLRHYPRVLASNQPRAEQPANYYRVPLESMTSPPRGRPELDLTKYDANRTGEESSKVAKSRTPSPRPPRVSASSPVRGIQNENRRKYVVPEWARTSTSTQPRLSEDAQRALQEAEEKKKLERAAARKRLPSVQAKLKAKNFSGKGQVKDSETKPFAPPPVPVAPKIDLSRGPIIASSDRPVFPTASVQFPFVSSTRSSSPPPQSNFAPKTPKTPIRERRNITTTPAREDESLFTPMGSGSLFGSARSLRTPLAPSILTSPLGNRKKAKISPMRSTLTGKGFKPISLTIANSSSDLKDTEIDKSSKKMNRELEDALDDLECPPSSLPIASSDPDVDSSYQSVPVENLDLEVPDGEVHVPVKQHWAGLPPSSPPAPSSPMLLTEEDGQTDDEMDDLPIATSDSELDTDMNDCDTDTPSPAVASPYDDNTPADSNNDMSFFPLPDETSAESAHISSSDLFEQFTNLNDHSDTLHGMGNIHLDPEMEALFQNGLENIDFSEFWATFTPLIAENTQSTQDSHVDAFIGQTESSTSFDEVNHAKLADEMQTLLSGCLM
ncbi:hypothetical protein JR316_0002054 [Psilocybe cubensis]|uniref:Ams2/SPT21 N-terminal domain-containing protein n=2 Tax=Psilocybe cubensis TaxID=181762 RepID=A0A8H7Y7W9_PSICU|nr:hypothetical protein JR316_0002054 [Psilocybe cubensis]KAH9485147.1 hypothetical protein JR316_0002054 [Psilocybe cubensis]